MKLICAYFAADFIPVFMSVLRFSFILPVLFAVCIGYSLPWESSEAKYPSNFAAPLQVAVEASNGASDYGNKFGEPVICGFARSFGCQLSNGERREWVKPIMFSGGIGSMNAAHTKKFKPEVGMLVRLGLTFWCRKYRAALQLVFVVFCFRCNCTLST